MVEQMQLNFAFAKQRSKGTASCHDLPCRARGAGACKPNFDSNGTLSSAALLLRDWNEHDTSKGGN